jgi:hypothetical protein
VLLVSAPGERLPGKETPADHLKAARWDSLPLDEDASGLARARCRNLGDHGVTTTAL